ncbi:MAG: phosphatidylglycerol lysyltransferase domain-containing protein [Clostridiales Family XIII bacterium]|jgi:hypothetical protein|nr:phosphatidylglycerol lysyltransferase domain-containing protein [Clostridiales Family XIII bacterium]
MYIFNNKFDLKDRDQLDPYFTDFEYMASGMSFSSLYMWRDINNFSYEIIGDYLCIAGTDNLEPGLDRHFLVAPLTRTGSYESKSLRATIEAARDQFQSKGAECYLMLVPEHLKEVISAAFADEIEWAYDRDNSDYVYHKMDLIELKGRAFHKKKNHLNYFLNNYPEYEYVTLTSDMQHLANDFIREFNERKDLQDPHERMLLDMEEEAMRDVFGKIEDIGLLAGAILIDGKIQALSLGGRIGEYSVVCHVEKANIEYRGLYQLINREWCRHLPEEIRLVNREEDMGLPGLRKAKTSYQPCCMVDKYTALIK